MDLVGFAGKKKVRLRDEMRVETRKKGSGEKGKYKLGYAAAAKHVGKCLVCPPRDCSSAINVCKKFFLNYIRVHTMMKSWWWRSTERHLWKH